MEIKPQMEHNNSTTIKALFENDNFIRIPAYQRAYSWEEKQCGQFLEDLMEQKGKRYYLGQFLFEKDGATTYIIDGQQRLTTTILFLSAIAKIKSGKGLETERIKAVYLTDVFETIDDDQLIFKKITQKHLITTIDATETLSQKRLIHAFLYFEAALNKVEDETLALLQHTLEHAVITTFYISSKVEATQVFEYQNNRGKELSRFEVIKAYLMHQVYIHSNDSIQANQLIAVIQSRISKTYRFIEAVEGYFTENELLDNYCNLYYNVDGYIEFIKKKLGDTENKTQWITAFFEAFMELTHSAKTIVANKHQVAISNLFFIGNTPNWKLVLLTIFSKGENSGQTFEKILKLLEVLAFKLKLGDYRTDYLLNYAKRYFNPADSYDINHLYEEIKHVTEYGFKPYWNDNDRFKNIIKYHFEEIKHHYSPNRIKFVLWQYENHLRNKNRSGSLLDKELFDNYTIEHISPQNPTNIVYTEEFKRDHLQLAGNLALLTQSQNSKFGNKSFEKKSELFQDTALTSYTEIREKSQWTEVEITERHQRITSFVKEYFSTEGL